MKKRTHESTVEHVTRVRKRTTTIELEQNEAIERTVRSRTVVVVLRVGLACSERVPNTDSLVLQLYGKMEGKIPQRDANYEFGL